MAINYDVTSRHLESEAKMCLFEKGELHVVFIYMFLCLRCCNMVNMEIKDAVILFRLTMCTYLEQNLLSQRVPP